MVHRPTPRGTEDFVRFERAPAEPEVTYRVALGEAVAGLRLVAGTLELLVLRTLAIGAPMHGFAVLDWIRETTDDVLVVEDGALYPALRRMEKRGEFPERQPIGGQMAWHRSKVDAWLKGEWRPKDKKTAGDRIDHWIGSLPDLGERVTDPSLEEFVGKLIYFKAA